MCPIRQFCFDPPITDQSDMLEKKWESQVLKIELSLIQTQNELHGQAILLVFEILKILFY